MTEKQPECRKCNTLIIPKLHQIRRSDYRCTKCINADNRAYRLRHPKSVRPPFRGIKEFQHLSRAHVLSAMPMTERILMNCVPEPNTGCWLWTGATNNRGSTGGYGRIGLGGKLLCAHRASYEAFCGPIPAGLSIDHLCRVHCCVNPDHLEAVTPQVNVLRGQTIVRVNAEKTHCIHGHEFTPENTYVVPRTGERMCRACARINDKRHYWQSAKRRERAR